MVLMSWRAVLVDSLMQKLDFRRMGSPGTTRIHGVFSIWPERGLFFYAHIGYEKATLLLDLTI